MQNGKLGKWKEILKVSKIKKVKKEEMEIIKRIGNNHIGLMLQCHLCSTPKAKFYLWFLKTKTSSDRIQKYKIDLSNFLSSKTLSFSINFIKNVFSNKSSSKRIFKTQGWLQKVSNIQVIRTKSKTLLINLNQLRKKFYHFITCWLCDFLNTRN